MKLNIKEKYYVVDNTVYCELTGKIEVTEDFTHLPDVKSPMKSAVPLGSIMELLTTKLNSTTIKVKAKAVCAPSDKFDEELGRKIARSRAMMKLTRRISRDYLNPLSSSIRFVSDRFDILNSALSFDFYVSLSNLRDLGVIDLDI